MHYAEKELREAMAYLEQARLERDAIHAVQRALELGQAVQVSFRSATHGFTTLCPNKSSEKLLTKLEQEAFERVLNLEKQEVYWCQEVAHLAKQEGLNMALREHPEKCINDFKAEAQAQEQAMERSRPDYVAPSPAV